MPASSSVKGKFRTAVSSFVLLMSSLSAASQGSAPAAEQSSVATPPPIVGTASDGVIFVRDDEGDFDLFSSRGFEGGL